MTEHKERSQIPVNSDVVTAAAETTPMVISPQLEALGVTKTEADHDRTLAAVQTIQDSGISAQAAADHTPVATEPTKTYTFHSVTIPNIPIEKIMTKTEKSDFAKLMITFLGGTIGSFISGGGTPILSTKELIPFRNARIKNKGKEELASAA